MNIIARTVRHLFCLLFVSIAVSCQQQTPPALPAEAVVQPDAYELFVRAHPRYPRTMEIYRNKELMAKADPYSPIYICLSQQRGRLYVDGKVAADWPVSTGTSKRATPTGRFRVQEKKKTYSSRTWGRMYDADGKCINKDADTRKDRIPALASLCALTSRTLETTSNSRARPEIPQALRLGETARQMVLSVRSLSATTRLVVMGSRLRSRT